MFGLAATRIRVAAALRGGAEVDFAVKFAHEAPASEEHEKERTRIFGPRVSFGAKTSELFVGAATTALPLRTANPELSSILEREAARLSLRPDAPIVDRVRAAIEHGMRDGDVSLEAVAKKLALGARTVQRLLQRDGTSYADVLDGVRREVALRSVADGKPPLGELSYTLGFAQPSAFYRAFRRWTGCSPAEWRAKRGA
jgi:AraC-like DNA-binding protein